MRHLGVFFCCDARPDEEYLTTKEKTLTYQPAARAATPPKIFKHAAAQAAACSRLQKLLFCRSANIVADPCIRGCVLGAVAARAAGVI